MSIVYVRFTYNAFMVRVALLAALAVPALAWQSVRLEPNDIAMQGPGQSQHFIVTAAEADGTEQDVTAAAQIRSSNPSVVAIDGRRLVAKTPGTATVTVQYQGRTQESVIKVGERSDPLEISFSRDVLSILTTKGCNSSSCHGSPAGQNGFKLSLFGQDLAADHKMIVEMHSGRRLNRTSPEESLLLKKPLMAVPHGGGRLMSKDADEYRTLLDWLKQGARLDAGGPRIARLELFPSERILVGAGRQQPIAVIGRMSNGTTRDMTREVRFSVVDLGVVSESGAVLKASGRGLTNVMARAMGKTATAQIIVIPARTAVAAVQGNNFIDKAVYDKLRKVNIAPYPVADDRTFIRRVFLDVIGQVPTPDEVHAFVSDPRADKRAILIDALLERPEYAANWMVKFEDWFRNAQFNSQGRTNASFKWWIRDVVESDQPYNETVRQLITSQGDTTVRPAANFWHPATDFMTKVFELNKATPTVSRLFLGMRIECAECHNHPLENLTQDDFYGMAAFFARLKVKHGYAQYRRVWYNDREGEVLHPVTKKPVAPKFLFGDEPRIADGEDRRKVLAEWIVTNPQFARATVNRVWSEYFGTGIVEPHDDFRSTNRPTNPELLEQLARHFADSGYRFKALHRVILNSRVYQTASRSPERPGESGPLEKLLFARYEPKRLPAESLLDSIVQVTGVAHKFGSYPEGTSAKELIAVNGPEYFLDTFGFPRRDVLQDREKSPSLAQALHLMNSENIRLKVEGKDNVLGKAVESGAEDRQIVEQVWERAFSRLPTEREWNTLNGFLQQEYAAGRTRRRALEGVLWSVLNSKEFRINQ